MLEVDGNGDGFIDFKEATLNPKPLHLADTQEEADPVNPPALGVWGVGSQGLNP